MRNMGQDLFINNNKTNIFVIIENCQVQLSYKHTQYWNSGSHDYTGTVDMRNRTHNRRPFKNMLGPESSWTSNDKLKR